MTKAETKLLLDRYQNGTANQKERSAVDTWYNKLASETGRVDLTEDLPQSKQLIWQQIEEQTKQPKTLKFPYKEFSIAAAIILVVSSLIIYRHKENHTQQITQLSYIKPGKNAATLTLGNGEKIYIADEKPGQIAQENNLKITKTATGEIQYTNQSQNTNPEIHSITTYRGEQQTIILPDGSKVWMNAASSLKFLSSFAGLPARRVELSGEAYFEVSKDSKHPFLVTTVNQTVEVLGTHFNINGYGDNDRILTTLLEGSVRIFALSEQNALTNLDRVDQQKNFKAPGPSVTTQTVLIPGEQATLKTNNQKISVQRIDTQDAIAWKEGKFKFNSEELSTIMKSVERWYNIEVQYKDGTENIKIWGTISRYADLSKVLALLSASGDLKFNLSGRTLTVSK